MSLKLLLVFAISEFLLSLTPGPAVFLVVSQGMHTGFRSSLRGTAGILTGNAIYFTLSALGLGALLIASATLFQIIKWLGIAYLILLGIRMLVFTNEVKGGNGRRATSRLALFTQGLVTQLSNPRAIVFFTALLPQFISPASREPGWLPGAGMAAQFIVLGLVSIAVEFPVMASYGWLADRGGSLIPERFSSLPARVAGGFLISAGVGLALMRRG
jgi:threonine/homoserine/homoserine lactone efflux protein